MEKAESLELSEVPFNGDSIPGTIVKLRVVWQARPEK